MFKKTFYILLLRNDPRTSSLTTLCITHCYNLSICLLLLICLYSSPIMFLNFRFVPKQLYCLFLIIVQSSSMFLVSFSCFWQLNYGMNIVAENSLPPLVTVDSDSNQLGHFILAEMTEMIADQEIIILSYIKTWYVCGYSFSYQLSGNSELSLRTTSGNVLWSSSTATSGWVSVSSSGEQFLTGNQEETLEFVIRGTGVAGMKKLYIQ